MTTIERCRSRAMIAPLVAIGLLAIAQSQSFANSIVIGPFTFEEGVQAFASDVVAWIGNIQFTDDVGAPAGVISIGGFPSPASLQEAVTLSNLDGWAGLGSGTSVTVRMGLPVLNGPGEDFVLFEKYANEKLIVEVSADGLSFTTPFTTPDPIDVLEFDNAVAIDLTTLGVAPGDSIRYVRVGNIVATPELSAVGALNVPEPSTFTLMVASAFVLFASRRARRYG